MFAGLDTTDTSDIMKSDMEQKQENSHRVGDLPARRAERIAYVTPRLERRSVLQRVTLVSGQDCVFDPPGTC